MSATGGRRRQGWRGFGMVLAAVVAAGLVVLLPSLAVEAQEPPSLRELEIQYQGRRAEYDGAMEAALAQRAIWDEKVTALDQALRSGDPEAHQLALADLRTTTRELERLESRVRELKEGTEGARVELLAALYRRQDELQASFAGVAGGAESRRLEALLRDAATQYRTVEGQALPADPVAALAPSSPTFDPRNGARDIRAKIQIIERQVQESDSAIAEVERLSADLRRLQRVRQMSGDFIGNLERYGDTWNLTGQQGPPGASRQGMPADSTALERPLTLEEQIEEMERLKERLTVHRDQLNRRAEEFRERLRRIGE